MINKIGQIRSIIFPINYSKIKIRKYYKQTNKKVAIKENEGEILILRKNRIVIKSH